MELNIGGVNEHFNFPWRNAIENNIFQNAGIHLKWNDIAGGTGEMIKKLANNNLNLAVLLTEGLFSESLKNKELIPLQFYVTSPLQWAIHVRNTENYQVSEIYNLKFAISRLNSGSHLMAIAGGNKFNKVLHDHQFIICNSLEGGLTALQKKEADVFLWEKYTTEPFLEKYQLKSIGTLPTPWPPFCIATNQTTLNKFDDQIKLIQKIIIDQTIKIKNDLNSVQIISDQYQIPLDRIQRWFDETEWNTNLGIAVSKKNEILNMLEENSLIPKLNSKGFR